MGFTWFGDGIKKKKTIRFLQAKEDLLRPIPNIVLVQCVEMICMTACYDQKTCMRTIHHRTLLLSPALTSLWTGPSPAPFTVFGEKKKMVSVPIFAAILSEFLGIFQTPLGRERQAAN